MEESRSIELSIIVPSYNRKESLKKCLLSLLGQDYPKNRYEVIVVDDGSSDGTSEMMRNLTNENDNLGYFRQNRKGPAAARNLGIKRAAGDIVGFTDNDCILSSDWARKMVESHSLFPEAMAIGGVTKVNNLNIRAVISQSLSDGAIQLDCDGKPEVIFFPTCNVSIKRKYLKEYFDERFSLPAGEDLDFFWRYYEKGHKFIYKQDIVVFHDCNGSLKSFLKQAYLYGRGNYLVQHIHKNHPWLKEIKTQDSFSFICGLSVNLIKIARFSYLLGRKLIRSRKSATKLQRVKIYFYFSLHKIMYLSGNIVEHNRLIRKSGNMANPPIPEGENISLFRRPEFIILDLTHRCNLKCNICEIRKDDPIKELTTDEVKEIISQSLQWGIKDFVLSGGEPLIRDDIFDILDFVKEKKYHIGILTNGILLDDNFLNKLLPYLTSNSLSVSISIDALTPEIHDDIRGTRGAFALTVNGLKILSRLKQDYTKINFNTISILLNNNLEEMLSLAEFLKRLNVNSIQFQPLLYNNLIMKERSNMSKYWISDDRLPVLDDCIDALIKFKQQNFDLVRNSENNLSLVKKYFRGLLDPTDVACLYGTRTMLIANNGDVTTCFDCYGDVRKGSIKSIYFSKESEKARQNIRNCRKPCLLPCFTDN